MSFRGQRRDVGRKIHPIHPGCLRGKQIGMFYAHLSRQKREERGKTSQVSERKKLNIDVPLGEIIVSNNRQHEIEKLLSETVDLTTVPQRNITTKEFLSSVDENQKGIPLIEEAIEDTFSKAKITTLRSNEADDAKMKLELEEKFKSEKYRKFLNVRNSLPCFAKRLEIINAIKSKQVTLISGETGCGKTTQIPQYVLEDRILSLQGSCTKIICTQPRRISAISVSERVADEQGEIIGNGCIGYQIRLERRLPRSHGSITFCTTGILLKRMEIDPLLTNVSHLILDEIHERDLFCDFIVTLIKQLITRRTDLKVILMSATFNSDAFAKYFDNCCVKITIPGFTFPVKEYYLEDVLNIVAHEFPKPFGGRYVKKSADFIGFIEPYVRQIASTRQYSYSVSNQLLNPRSEELDFDLITKLIIKICSKKPGAILVFLPGYSDIYKVYEQLQRKLRSSHYLIIPLHSQMPSVEQRTIFTEPPPGVRKIIISTNIAETSITINDVVYVIDCGKIKIQNYDPQKNIDSLIPQWVSLANADQRRGRAGRVKPGECYHLYTRARKMILDAQQKPEILRKRLENVILQIKMLKLGNAAEFLGKVMDAPCPLRIQRALVILQNLNVLDVNENLTPLGYHLATLPMCPQMGKMILMGALFSCLDPILSVAVSLDYKDAFQTPLGKEKEALERKKNLCENWNSDHLILHEALSQYSNAKSHGRGRNYCWHNFLSANTLDLLQNMKKQLADYLLEMKFLSDSDFKNPKYNYNSKNKSLVKAVIASGLYPNLGVLYVNKPGRKIILTADGETVNLVKSSVNFDAVIEPSPLMIYFKKLESTKKIYIHDSTMVFPLPLFFFGDQIIINKTTKGTVIELPMKVPFKFYCKSKVAYMLRHLRQKLDGVLESKISNPGVIDWTSESSEVNILRAIMKLITSEDLGGLNPE